MAELVRVNRPWTIFGIRIIAIVETLIFLTVLTILNFIFGDGKRFVTYSLHPFWVIILLVTVQYGTSEGIAATLLSTLFLYAGNLPKQTVDQSLFDYQFQIVFIPSLWFITAFILGEIRNRITWENHLLKEKYSLAQKEAETITSAYEVLKETNENLAIQLSSQEKTAAQTYKTFGVLGSSDPAEVIFGSEIIVETALNPEKFSLYALGPYGFEATTCHGWSSSDKFINRFTDKSPLYDEIAKKRRMVCIVNKADREILGKEGLVANPLIDKETGEVFGMLKVEKMRFLDLNLSKLETFRIVCDLISTSYTNAKRAKRLQKSSIRSPYEELYSYEFFKEQCKFLKNLKTPLHPVVLTIFSRRIKEMALNNLKKILPVDALICDGAKKESEIKILLASLKKGEKENIELAVRKNDEEASIEFSDL